MKLNIIVLKHLSDAQKAVQAAHVVAQLLYNYGSDNTVICEWFENPTIILREASFTELEVVSNSLGGQRKLLHAFFEEDSEMMGFGPLTAVAVLITEPWPQNYVDELLDITRLRMV